MIQKQIQEMLDHQSIIRTSDVVKKGIPKPYLNRMVENGQLIKVARGIISPIGLSMMSMPFSNSNIKK